jgi:hypothetical protein
VALSYLVQILYALSLRLLVYRPPLVVLTNSSKQSGVMNSSLRRSGRMFYGVPCRLDLIDLLRMMIDRASRAAAITFTHTACVLPQARLPCFLRRLPTTQSSFISRTTSCRCFRSSVTTTNSNYSQNTASISATTRSWVHSTQQNPPGPPPLDS